MNDRLAEIKARYLANNEDCLEHNDIPWLIEQVEAENKARQMTADYYLNIVKDLQLEISKMKAVVDAVRPIMDSGFLDSSWISGERLRLEKALQELDRE